MPIDFFKRSGIAHVRQSFISPTVYLDHWALRLFSDETILQDRFVEVLLNKKGTLLLSNISFLEFARPDDRRHCIAAEQFLERLLPNIYLSDTSIDKLQTQEMEEPDNRKRFWPPADLPQLKLFSERAQDTPLGFTMKGFISIAHDLHTQLEPVTKEVVEMIRGQIEFHRSDVEYVRKVKHTPPNSKRTRTYVLLSELMREFHINPSLEIKDNDIIDMLHAIVSVNCCDFALLDSAWTNRVLKLKQRIQKTGTEMPLALCYSQRQNGVSKFLDDLENFECI